MFSTHGSSHAIPSTSRNSRRRQRTSPDDSLPPRAKRQRPTVDRSNQDISVSEVQRESYNENDASIELPFRGPESNHTMYDDGKTILLKNDLYSIAHPPFLPNQIRGRVKVPFRCIISAEYGFSLALTQHHAIAWPHQSDTYSNDVVTFTLPEPSTRSDDHLPLGTFISGPSSPGDIGLVTVVPSTGKLTLWESLSNNAIIGIIKQKQNGVHGSIPGMMSGEFAIEIISAEPAGVIIVLSTGRVAHVTIADAQGKPILNVQFLHQMTNAATGGFFGGIKSVFTGATWRRRIAAAKANGSSRRGQRDVIIATTSGSVEIWDVRWNNGSDLRVRIDVAQKLTEALRTSSLITENNIKQMIHVLDFSLQQETKKPSTSPSEVTHDLSIWLLFSIDCETTPSYFVAGLSFAECEPILGPIYTVNYKRSPKQSLASWGPKIYVPKPGTMAFIVFEGGMVLLALPPTISPSVGSSPPQVHDTHAGFQDVVRFRKSEDYSVVGCNVENSRGDQNSSCVLMIRNYGLVRVSFSPSRVSSYASLEEQITTKSRLEQIVFFESVKNNPIDFSPHKEISTSISELDTAALEISGEILRSTSKYIPSPTPSLEQQLNKRATALQSLATYLIDFQDQFSYSTRWRLLWNAEKMAAHIAIWRVHESIRKEAPGEKTYLEGILEKMGKKFKTKSNTSDGEKDLVQQWFVHDTWQMEYIIPWILNGIRDSYNEPPTFGARLVTQISHASELSLATLETAYQFRRDNLQLYGLSANKDNESNVPSALYGDLPEFWTSSTVIYGETEQLLDAELNTCIKWMRHDGTNDEVSKPTALSSIRNLKKNIPRGFEVLAQIYTERSQWCAAQHRSDLRKGGRILEKMHIERRKTQLYKMAAIGLLEEAITLAEKFRDMVALVELMVELQDQIKQRQIQPRPEGVSSEEPNEEMTHWRDRIDNYFIEYGEPWADAFFTRQISAGQPAMLLIMQEYREHVTRFLRKRPGYAKISWINEILGERNYSNASKSLGNLAVQQETDLWAKRIELGLGKLATLAMFEGSPSQGNTSRVQGVTRFDDQAELAAIQQLLHDHILPGLHGAIDQSAKLQLANDQFAKVIVVSKPAFRETLQRGLAKLVAGCPMEPDELIDLLTLMDPVRFPESEDHGIVGHEFTLALRVLNLSEFSQQDSGYRVILEKIIWCRCMIRDNWEAINSTSFKTDDEIESELRTTVLFGTILDYTEGFASELDSCRLYTPSDIVNSNIFPHRLASRLLPEQRAHLSDDQSDEQKTLRNYIDKGGLEYWFAWIVNRTKSLNSNEDA